MKRPAIIIFKRKKKIKKLLNSFGKIKVDSFDFNLIEKYFRKNVIIILEINNYPENVINEANEISHKIDKL